jgi:hypothetical protein
MTTAMTKATTRKMDEMTGIFREGRPRLTPEAYFAPFPNKTAGMVFNRIWKSSHSDQLSM